MTHADNKMQVYGKSREAITTKKKIIDCTLSFNLILDISGWTLKNNKKLTTLIASLKDLNKHKNTDLSWFWYFLLLNYHVQLFK